VSGRRHSAPGTSALTRRLHDDEHLLIVADGDGSLLALSEAGNADHRLRVEHNADTSATRRTGRSPGGAAAGTAEW